MQLDREKEYIVVGREQTDAMYSRDGGTSNLSQVDYIENPDLSTFPLLEHARGMRFRLGRRDGSFPQAGGIPLES
jgi:hypothetical protein